MLFLTGKSHWQSGNDLFLAILIYWARDRRCKGMFKKKHSWLTFGHCSSKTSLCTCGSARFLLCSGQLNSAL